MCIDQRDGVTDQEDWVEYGVEGLIQAVDRFDASVGASFAAFASPRIRGAVFDAMRRLDPLARTQRTRASRIATTRNKLEMTLAREPTADELCAATGLASTQISTALKVAGYTRVTITTSPARGNVRSLRELSDVDDPTMGVERREAHNALAVALDSLPDRERSVIALYFNEELRLCDVANMFGISDTRVSQLLRRGLTRLRRNSRLAEAVLPAAA